MSSVQWGKGPSGSAPRSGDTMGIWPRVVSRAPIFGPIQVGDDFHGPIVNRQFGQELRWELDSWATPTAFTTPSSVSDPRGVVRIDLIAPSAGSVAAWLASGATFPAIGAGQAIVMTGCFQAILPTSCVPFQGLVQGGGMGSAPFDLLATRALGIETTKGTVRLRYGTTTVVLGSAGTYDWVHWMIEAREDGTIIAQWLGRSAPLRSPVVHGYAVVTDPTTTALAMDPTPLLLRATAAATMAAAVDYFSIVHWSGRD